MRDGEGAVRGDVGEGDRAPRFAGGRVHALQGYAGAGRGRAHGTAERELRARCGGAGEEPPARASCGPAEGPLSVTSGATFTATRAPWAPGSSHEEEAVVDERRRRDLERAVAGDARRPDVREPGSAVRALALEHAHRAAERARARAAGQRAVERHGFARGDPRRGRLQAQPAAAPATCARRRRCVRGADVAAGFFAGASAPGASLFACLRARRSAPRSPSPNGASPASGPVLLRAANALERAGCASTASRERAREEGGAD